MTAQKSARTKYVICPYELCVEIESAKAGTKRTANSITKKMVYCGGKLLVSAPPRGEAKQQAGQALADLSLSDACICAANLTRNSCVLRRRSGPFGKLLI